MAARPHTAHGRVPVPVSSRTPTPVLPLLCPGPRQPGPGSGPEGRADGPCGQVFGLRAAGHLGSGWGPAPPPPSTRAATPRAHPHERIANMAPWASLPSRAGLACARGVGCWVALWCHLGSHQTAPCRPSGPEGTQGGTSQLSPPPPSSPGGTGRRRGPPGGSRVSRGWWGGALVAPESSAR